MRQRWKAAGVGLAVVAAAIATALAVGRDGAAGKKVKPEVTLEFAAREVVQPQALPLAVEVSFSGPLVAPQTAVVRAKSAGTLLALRVAEGDRVRAGQPLGTLDAGELAGRVAERRALLASAQAQLDQADRTHATNRRLADQQFISTQALEASQAALETARAQAAAVRAQLDAVQAGWRDAALVAPIAGWVAKRHVVPGEKLAPEQPVITIVDLARLELAGSVGTHEVARLAPGQAVEVRVEGVAEAVAGRLARIAPAADPGTRAIGVAVVIDNPKEALRAGQYALARVVLPDAVPRLTLPAAAVAGAAGDQHVWLIERGVLARRSVSTGRRQGDRVELLAGVGPEAQVLAARFDNLREGAKAVVLAKPSPAVAAASAPVVK